MTDWVAAQARDWGRWHREQSRASGYPATSIWARILEGGSISAGIIRHSRSVPARSMPRDVLDVHRAWLTLPETDRIVLWTRYVPPGDIRERLADTGIPKSTYYRWLSRAQVRLGQALLTLSAVSQESHLSRPHSAISASS